MKLKHESVVPYSRKARPSQCLASASGLARIGSSCGEWRYRLGVRTHGSQPWNPGSIPGTATILRSRSHAKDALRSCEAAEEGLIGLASFGWQAQPLVTQKHVARNALRVEDLWSFSGRRACWAAIVLKRFVYVLKNHETPPRYYTGATSDVRARHAYHNAGRCFHTAKYGPWTIDVVVEFADEQRALAFERYLKSGSGVAFAQRHLR
jgi:putative endonuclease